MGFDRGIELDGLAGESRVSFRMPSPAKVSSALLHLKVRFARSLMAASNVLVSVNGTRAATISSGQADDHGDVTYDLPIDPQELAGDYLRIDFRSSLAATNDRCLDQRLNTAFVLISSDSYLTYTLALRTVQTVRGLLAVLPDTLTISIPGRRLSSGEFNTVYAAALQLAREGHSVRYTRLPQLGDVVVGRRDEITSARDLVEAPDSGKNVSLYRYHKDSREEVGLVLSGDSPENAVPFLAPDWGPLTLERSFAVRHAETTWQELPDDPTLTDLGVTDLHRDFGSEAIWKIPLDLRDMPAGRVPSRLELRVATAPNTNNRDLLLFVYLNGTLVRSTDMPQSGSQHLIDVKLPAVLLTTRNELRVSLQRRREPDDHCQQLDTTIPAELLGSSKVITTKADKSAELFTGIAASLTPGFPLYLPETTLDNPQPMLPMLVSLGKAFWTARRQPTAVVYHTVQAISPATSFMIIGQPSLTLDAPLKIASGRLSIHKPHSSESILDIDSLETWTVAQVVKLKGQYGVQVIPARVSPKTPYWPDAYGNTNLVISRGDSTVYQLNSAGRDAGLLFNDGPTLIERFKADWLLWGAFALLAIGPIIILSIRALIRRTPRRVLTRGFSRQGPVVQS